MIEVATDEPTAGKRKLPPLICQRHFIIQPGVARNELPWVEIIKISNPEWVASIPDISFVALDFIYLQQSVELVLE